jgi:hypothetical protein
MPPAQPDAQGPIARPLRARWWSTKPGDFPGVYRRGNRWHARITIAADGHGRSRWLYLGSFEHEWDAIRCKQLADERKRRGEPIRRAA